MCLCESEVEKEGVHLSVCVMLWNRGFAQPRPFQAFIESINKLIKPLYYFHAEMIIIYYTMVSDAAHAHWAYMFIIFMYVCILYIQGQKSF